MRYTLFLITTAFTQFYTFYTDIKVANSILSVNNIKYNL